MTLQQLEYVLAVDMFRHFAKAAEHCKVTQPTLSMMIQKLEEELNVKLFDRSTQPIEPTIAGLKVIEQARRVIYQTSLIKDIVNEESNSLKGIFRLAVLPTIAPYLLPRFFPQLMEKYPELDVRVMEMKTQDCMSMLASGKVDAAIIANTTDEKQLQSDVLFYEQFFGYVSRKESIFKNELIRSSDINGERLWLLDEGHCFRDQLMRFCQMEAVKLHQASYRLGSMETFMRMVESGKGITFIPELALLQLSSEQKELVRSFAVPKPTRQICMVARKDYVRNSILNLLKEAIKKSVPKEMLTLQGIQRIV
ncbi:MAG: hydrogen peroxide-inducible genes activator [Bacteroides sp.]